jgi:RNA polymerase sigma factor (sigma-70 family)
LLSTEHAISDVELVNGLLSQNQKLFPLFYDRYSRLIRHCIRRNTNTDVDDIFQDFFFKLINGHFRVLNGWDRQSRLSGYLSVITRRFVIDHWRSGRTSRKLFEGLNAIDAEKHPADPSLEADFALDRRQFKRRAIAVWAKLKEKRDRQLICGVFHRETPAEKLAATLELSDGTFRIALFRAKQRYLKSCRLELPEYFP